MKRFNAKATSTSPSSGQIQIYVGPNLTLTTVLTFASVMKNGKEIRVLNERYLDSAFFLYFFYLKIQLSFLTREDDSYLLK